MELRVVLCAQKRPPSSSNSAPLPHIWLRTEKKENFLAALIRIRYLLDILPSLSRFVVRIGAINLLPSWRLRALICTTEEFGDSFDSRPPKLRRWSRSFPPAGLEDSWRRWRRWRPVHCHLGASSWPTSFKVEQIPMRRRQPSWSEF